MTAIESWGRFPRTQGFVRRLEWRSAPLPLGPEDPQALPYGLGRSYGDSCLNDGGVLLVTTGLDRFISFDRATGVLRAEAGVTLASILDLVVPSGWFLPVTPGTKFVTLGGAIANDVHGKNHHVAGTFGRFVQRFELLRSGGERLVCSPDENRTLFDATIGGLGLTGVITWVDLRLRPVHNPWIQAESIRFRHIDEFFELNAASENDYEYIVAWIDCLSRGRSLGRGLFLRGNHASPQFGDVRAGLPDTPRRKLTFPVTAPPGLVNGLTVRAFNFAYYRKQFRKHVSKLVHYEPFFYPLDSIHRWNRVYGPRGFFQYQCALPFTGDTRQVHRLLETIARSGLGSPLVVFKTFGKVASPGLLSFPREGVTLAMDFPNRGQRTLELFEQLDTLVRDCGGSVYPAKDARMSAENFRSFFPRWTELRSQIDPAFGSSFWRRVAGRPEPKLFPIGSPLHSLPPPAAAAGEL